MTGSSQNFNSIAKEGASLIQIIRTDTNEVVAEGNDLKDPEIQTICNELHAQKVPLMNHSVFSVDEVLQDMEPLNTEVPHSRAMTAEDLRRVGLGLPLEF